MPMARRIFAARIQNIHTAFRVEEVERIYRVSWKDTRPVPRVGENACPVTSVLRQKKAFFRCSTSSQSAPRLVWGGMSADLKRSMRTRPIVQAEVPIVYADDSQLVRAMVKDSLTRPVSIN